VIVLVTPVRAARAAAAGRTPPRPSSGTRSSRRALGLAGWARMITEHPEPLALEPTPRERKRVS